jgi:hypothetical protein
MFNKTLYELTHNSDLTEGRGHTVSIAFMTDSAQAFKVVDDPRWVKYCVMGMHHPGRQTYDVRERNLLVYDSADEFWAQHDTATRKRVALAKLTSEERMLLGL